MTALLLTMAGFGSTMPALAEEMAAEAMVSTDGQYEYVLRPDGTAEIIVCNSGENPLIIPSNLDGHTVTAIGDELFEGCDDLRGVTIPDSVTTIGNRAFYDCESLTLTVTRDSYAEQYCKDNNLFYLYPDSLDWLNEE